MSSPSSRALALRARASVDSLSAGRHLVLGRSRRKPRAAWVRAHETQTECHAPCVWCTSAAVPSACYGPKAAARLPPAVFECKSRARCVINYKGPRDDDAEEARC